MHERRSGKLRDDADRPYAYLRIADAIAASIEAGTLRAGDRVPSVRRTAARWSVSVPTVLQAYRLLEARGIVRARPRSGYFVLAQVQRPTARPRVKRARTVPAAITTGDLIVRYLESVADPGLVPLATALPDPQLLPTARLARLLGGAARREKVRSAMVSSPSGAEELRLEIARRASGSRNPPRAGDIVVTCGCAEAVSLALRVIARPGDTIAVESPAYFGTLQAIEMLGLRAIEIATDPREGIETDALDRALRTRRVAGLVVTPTVHNPLGSVMPPARRQQLARIVDAFGTPVVEDETYAELHFGMARPPSLRAFVRTSPVLTCGSFSKTLASAYRVGWIVPGRLRAEVLRAKAATNVATPMPTQMAIAELLRTGGYDHHLRRLEAALRTNVERVTAEVIARFPDGTRVASPAGGFLLWVELPADVDALAVYRRCLEEGVSVAPGPIFSATGGYRNFVRLNGGLLWSDEIASALDIVAKAARRQSTMSPPLLKGRRHS